MRDDGNGAVMKLPNAVRKENEPFLSSPKVGTGVKVIGFRVFTGRVMLFNVPGLNSGERVPAEGVVLVVDGDDGKVPPRETGRAGAVYVLVIPPLVLGVEFDGNTKPLLFPSSNIFFNERSNDDPVFLISFNLRKSKFEVPLIPKFANTPGVVDRTDKRLLASVPRRVNNPDTLRVLPVLK